MIRASPSSAIALVGKSLRDFGYDSNQLGRGLDLNDGLDANFENLEPLLARTEGDSVIAVLARLFFIGWPVDESRCRAALPDDFLTAAFACGLLTQEAGEIGSSAVLIPFRSSIIASDSCRVHSASPDMVMGTSGSTHLPARLAIGGENEYTLDLGTGSGALALQAAHYSRKVIGADINPRTLLYAEFNAILNGIKNIEWREGDAFAPVAGERFSRILANPPFFLSPEKNFVYCDSPLPLDGFSASLARNASAYLEEGGFYQMISEWVEVEGESWEQRLRDWTAGSGCDVLVLAAPAMTPVAYAEKRMKEARLMRAEVAAGYFQKQLKYLQNQNVTNVLGGVINMRKRSGQRNWFAAVRTDPAGYDVGRDVRARFDALTFLATSDEDRIFKSKLRLAEDVVLDKRFLPTFESGDWQASSIEVVKQRGLIDRLRLDETVSGFLPLFDGTRTVAEIADRVARHTGVDAGEARRRCLELVRRLIQSNFVTAF